MESMRSSPLRDIPKICKYYQGYEDYGKPLQKLGEGTYGRVELYSGGEYGLPVAVKSSLLAKHLVGIFSSCVREPSILIHLHHPNIVRLLDVQIKKQSGNKLPKEDKTRGKVEILEIIMDNRGTQLTNFTDLPEIQIKRYIFQLLSAVCYLHSQGIYHRDIKPQNILIENDHLTLVDFGISRQSTSGSLEYTGEMFTLAFRPPEVLLNEKYDETADIWTVGTVWLFLLMGKTPFLDDKDVSSPKVVYRNIEAIIGLKERKDFFPLLRGKISKQGYKLLNMLLATNPKDRISPLQALEDKYFDNIRSQKIEKIYPTIGYQWQENSCYLDSLLMVLFTSKTNFWLDYILDFDPQSIKYETICQKNSLIKTQEQIEVIVADIQKFIRTSYLKLGKEPQTCQTLRQLLYQCYPDLKSKNRWLYYNPANIYTLLTDLFPVLKIPFSQIACYYKENYQPKPASLFSTACFTIAQFTEQEEEIKNRKEDLVKIEWQKINHPVIVFENTNNQPVKMESNILGKYELIGILVLLESKDHIISYYLDNKDEWKYYDGMEKEIKNKIPSFNSREIPLMFFYRNTLLAPVNIDYQYKLLTPKEALDSRCQHIRKHSDIVFEKRRLQVELLLLDCCEFDCYYKTFFLAVKLLDIFININPQLFGRGPRTVGLACLSLALKFYETKTFSLDKLADISEDTSNEDKIYRMEKNIFNHLCFNVNYSTAIDYYLLYNGNPEYLYRLACLIRSPYYNLSDEELAKKVIKFDKETEDMYEDYYQDDLETIDLLI